MAWRAIGDKGIRSPLGRRVILSSQEHVVGSTSKGNLDFTVRSVSAANCRQGFTSGSLLPGASHGNVLTKESFIRYFHNTPVLYSRKAVDEALGLKTERKGKFKRRDKAQMKPPLLDLSLEASE